MTRKGKFTEALTAAIRVLSEGTPILDYKDIAYEAVSRGYWITNHPQPEIFLNQALSYDIKTKKRKSLFVRIKDGVILKPGAKFRSGLYALRHRIIVPVISAVVGRKDPVQETIKHIETNITELQAHVEKLKKIS